MSIQTKAVWKKLAAVLLCVCMTASLAACGKSGNGGENGQKREATVTPGETEATPTQEITPAQETPAVTATPTAATTPGVTEAVPTPEEPTPTPAMGRKPEVRTGETYTIETITYGNSNDPGRQSDITVKNTSDGSVVFCASDYLKDHQSEWEAAATEEILELTGRIGDIEKRGIVRKTEDGEPYDLFMTEKQLYTCSLGAQGELGVYAHAMLYYEPGDCSEDSFFMGCYEVSCRLINDDMTQQYAVLFEKDIHSTFFLEGSFRVDFFYANKPGAPAKYDPDNTKRIMASVSFVENRYGEKYPYGMFESKFYGEGYNYGDEKLMALELFGGRTKHGKEFETPELGGNVPDGNGVVRYSKEGQDWQILSYQLSDIVNTLYHLKNKETVSFPEIAKQVNNGVFAASEPFETNTYYDYTIRTEVSLDGNDAVVRLYFARDDYEILLDDCRKTVYDQLQSKAGETLQVSGGIVESQSSWTFGPQNNYQEVPELTLRYFKKGASVPSATFESGVYLAGNRATFEKNAAAYEKTLRGEYKGTTVVKKKLLEEISLGDFGFLAIYEIAAYGETPEEIGDVNTVYRYQVVGVWVRNCYLSGMPGWEGETSVVEKVIFSAGNNGGATPEGAEDYITIVHRMMRTADAEAVKQGPIADVNKQFPIDMTGKPSTKDLVTYVRVGRYFDSTSTFHGDYYQYNYDERYYQYETCVDADGKYMIREYDTYHESTDGYGISGGEVKDDSGKVYYLYDKKVNTVKFMSYTARQIAAAMIARGADFDATITEKVPEGLADKIVCEKWDNDEGGYYVYSETAKLNDNDELIGVIWFTDPKWYHVEFYVVRDGKAICFFDEECMPFYNLTDDCDPY